MSAIRIDIVETDERFPHFAVGAGDLRVHSVLSMPIEHHSGVVGTFNLYSHAPSAFDDTSDDIARLASSQAAHAIVRSDVLTARPPAPRPAAGARRRDDLVARAQGVLVATQLCSAEQARHLIRRTAAATDDSLVATARRILAAARDAAIAT